MPSVLRKTRFVCVSDTHNASPADGAFKLPKGDVLIHAGDLTKQGTLAELQKTLKWIEKADFEVKIVIAGNHDITLDKDFYLEYAAHFHNQYPQDAEQCRQLMRDSPSIVYLQHKAVEIRLHREDGPHTTFKVFGSPLSLKKGLWAFQYEAEEGPELWHQIPLDTDVVITHTPPKYHCDETRHQEAGGCEALRQCLWRVRPLLSICGHVHEGRGVEIIQWDLGTRNAPYKEAATACWAEPNADNKKKMSLLDLTRESGQPLENDSELPKDTKYRAGPAFTTKGLRPISGEDKCLSGGKEVEKTTAEKSVDPALRPLQRGDVATIPPTVRGQGGLPPSGRRDEEALAGRLGRKETCVVNAAIMASSWPYTGKGGCQYRKPIVVDIDLPVWSVSDTVN